MTIDRSEVSRALAKALAYKGCGRDDMAARWAARLVTLLECAEILDTHEGWKLIGRDEPYDPRR